MVDALRADHLGCYGYARNTSPFLDDLANESIVFEKALANSSYTRESISCLFSGRLPSSSGSYGYGAVPADPNKNLGELFRRAGYKTGFLSTTVVLTDRAFTAGFDHVDHLVTEWSASGMSSRLSEKALEFVQETEGRKFMLYLHYLDPHAPYDPPEALYLRYADAIFPHRTSLYGVVRKRLPQLIADGFGPGDPRFEDVLLRYDAEITDVDGGIKKLFEGLARLQVLDNTLVILTADHGEEFLDHGFVEHAWTLYNESLHVPLIFWTRHLSEPRREEAWVSHVDLLPTLLEIMEISYDNPSFDGTSLYTTVGSLTQFRAPSKPLIAELLIKHRNVLRATIKDEWKYIAAQRWLTPEERAELSQAERDLIKEMSAVPFDVWGPVVHEELYNLEEDPLEQNNLIDVKPEKRQELSQVLADYRVSYKNGLGKPPPQARHPRLTQKEIERLRSLGYLGRKRETDSGP